MATEYPLKSGLNFGKPEYIAGVATVEKDWGGGNIWKKL